jgi:hypothetical protein
MEYFVLYPISSTYVGPFQVEYMWHFVQDSQDDEAGKYFLILHLFAPAVFCPDQLITCACTACPTRTSCARPAPSRVTRTALTWTRTGGTSAAAARSRCPLIGPHLTAPRRGPTCHEREVDVFGSAVQLFRRMKHSVVSNDLNESKIYIHNYLAVYFTSVQRTPRSAPHITH